MRMQKKLLLLWIGPGRDNQKGTEGRPGAGGRWEGNLEDRGPASRIERGTKLAASGRLGKRW